MFKILADDESSINILYRGALDRMKDSVEIAQAMINPQTASHLCDFDGNMTRSPGTIALPVRVDPYNVITEFYIIDVESPMDPLMKVISSSYHQILWYLTPSRTTEIRGDQALSRIITMIVRKKYDWMPKVIRKISDEDCPIGKKQKQIAA